MKFLPKRLSKRGLSNAVLLCVLLVLFLGCAYWAQRPPVAVPVQKSVGDGTGTPAEKQVYLTFDDGPSKHTREILAILRSENVCASFFVVLSEENKKYWPLVTTEEAYGNALALHSATHEYRRIYASSSAFWQDITLLKRRLLQYTKTTPQVLRFPGGSTNTVSHRYGGSGIMKTLLQEATQHGYTVLDWNVCGEDAAGGHPSAEAIYRNVVRDSQGTPVCVVLLHDTAATGNTVAALPSIIRWYKENGYTFCTVNRYEAAPKAK